MGNYRKRWGITGSGGEGWEALRSDRKQCTVIGNDRKRWRVIGRSGEL